jgi:TIR domain
MKVFISWSGSTSHKVAVALREWLPSVLQAIDPYVSSEDIDKGARWNTDISKELEDSSFGILCITPENLDAPWLNFEAGALSKSLDRARVAPFLFRVDRAAITGPLLQFQSTLLETDDVRKLVKSLNSALEGSALDEARIDEIFDVWWPKLEEALASIEDQDEEEKPPARKQADVLAEILDLARSQQKILGQPEELLPPRYLNFVLNDPGLERDISPRAIEDLQDRWQQVGHDVEKMKRTKTNSELLDGIELLGKPIEHILARLDPLRRRRARGRSIND